MITNDRYRVGLRGAKKATASGFFWLRDLLRFIKIKKRIKKITLSYSKCYVYKMTKKIYFNCISFNLVFKIAFNFEYSDLFKILGPLFRLKWMVKCYICMGEIGRSDTALVNPNFQKKVQVCNVKNLFLK